MTILTYFDMSGSTIAWDASTPELESVAFLELFRYFNDPHLDMYCNGVDCTPYEKPFYKKAKAGDPDAAKRLLVARKGARREYEDSWQLVDVITPESHDKPAAKKCGSRRKAAEG